MVEGMNQLSNRERALRAYSNAKKEWEKGKQLYASKEINHIGLAARMSALIASEKILIDNKWYEEKV
jgi:hypothetical protein